MTEPRFTITNEELHAFIDGEVDRHRAAEIARAVEADSALSRKVIAYRSDKLRLQSAYASALSDPLPQSWLDRIDDHARKGRARVLRGPIPERLLAIAAVILVVIVSWAISSTYFAAPGGEQIIGEALAARDQTTRPEEIFSADNAPAMARRDAIISAALAMKIRVPSLEKLGYRLQDVRIYNGVSGGKAVELDYRNAASRLFTLYVRRPSTPPRVDILERGSIRICIWQDDVVGAVMAGEMTAGEMARLASLAYSGLYL